jgi:hypothetical protein
MENNDDLYQVKKKPVVKIEENAEYQRYSLKIVKDVPHNDMMILLTLFLNKAANNTGKENYDSPDETKESVLEFLYAKFSFLPVHSVGSAIIKGSLGQYGPGRLIPRVIYGWMVEASNEYQKRLNHEKYSKQTETTNRLDVLKYPAGRAIIKKADWLYLGIINSDEYDRIPLMEVAERIGKGMDVVPELWGIKSRKPKN